MAWASCRAEEHHVDIYEIWTVVANIISSPTSNSCQIHVEHADHGSNREEQCSYIWCFAYENTTYATTFRTPGPLAVSKCCQKKLAKGTLPKTPETNGFLSVLHFDCHNLSASLLVLLHSNNPAMPYVGQPDSIHICRSKSLSLHTSPFLPHPLNIGTHCAHWRPQQMCTTAPMRFIGLAPSPGRIAIGCGCGEAYSTHTPRTEIELGTIQGGMGVTFTAGDRPISSCQAATR